MSPLSSTVLTGWAGGPAADRLAEIDVDAIVADALCALSKLFAVDRARVTALLEAHFLADWRRDPFSCGAYSYAAVGGAEAARRLAEPVVNTLYFAGEHTHATLNGTVAGALASGYRAADQIAHSKADIPARHRKLSRSLPNIAGGTQRGSSN
jgi:monoamine oxidase